MKMNRVAFLSCLVLFASLLLQGCSWFSSEEKKEKAKTEGDALDEEVTAQCSGGKFSCNGNATWRQWCSKMERKCAGHPDSDERSCMPQCTWACESQKCDAVCAPKCGQALCSTRCKNFDTQNCKMKCGKPDCKVVCPKHACPGNSCPACKTQCGKPVCKMECEDSEQPCRHVCAQPKCKWECKKPQECPKPKCEMKCEKPRNCMDNTHMVQQMPPLRPGETEVEAFQTPPHLSAAAPSGAPSPAAAASPAAALISQRSKKAGQTMLGKRSHASTLRVDITTMRQDESLHKDQVNLEVVQDVSDEPAIWTTLVSVRKGHMTQSTASCKSGTFHCKGDSAWCSAERKKKLCESNEVKDGLSLEVLSSQQVQKLETEGADSQEAEAAAEEAMKSALEPSEPVKVAKAEEDVDASVQAEAEGEDDHAVFLQRHGKQSRLHA